MSIGGVKNKRPSVPYHVNHKYMNNIEYKLCSDCDEWMPMETSFYKNRSAPDGFNPYCKECTKKRSKKWRADNPENHQELYLRRNAKPKQKESMKKASRQQHENGYYKNYQQTNKEKFNLYGKNKREHRTHEISNDEWENCKNYFNYRCAYCGVAIEDHIVKFKGKWISSDFHKEHVDDKGANNLSNCVPSCKNCNSQKWEFELEEWYSESNSTYSEERKLRIINWLENDYKLYIES